MYGSKKEYILSILATVSRVLLKYLKVGIVFLSKTREYF